MKKLQELHLPEGLKYTQEHEWALEDGDTVRIGITDFAQDQLGDIVYVELPETGIQLSAREAFSTVESVKAVSEVYMPLGGEISAVNRQLEDNPQLVNQSPYDQGWLVEIKPADLTELKELMDKNQYLEMLKGEI